MADRTHASGDGNATGFGVPPSGGPDRVNAELQTTGLPGLRTWRAVYVLVLVLFAVDILLLYTLEKMFS